MIPMDFFHARHIAQLKREELEAERADNPTTAPQPSETVTLSGDELGPE